MMVEANKKFIIYILFVWPLGSHNYIITDINGIKIQMTRNFTHNT